MSSTNFLELLGCLTKEYNTIEAVFGNLLLFRSLDDAFGEQLDGIGQIVGELRQARPDTEYRSAIIYRIALNSSGGQADVIIDFVYRATQCAQVRFEEWYPAGIAITVQGGTVYSGLVQQIDALCAAGVRLIELNYIPDADVFAFAGEDATHIDLTPVVGLGFDEYGWADPAGRGGKISELYL